jgi:mono/diheme cytochrome c family protein
MPRRSPPRLRHAALLLLASASLAFAASAEPRLSYNRDIRPILSDSCFNCHGQDAGSRKGGLRLDEREDALKGGKSGTPAIVPGKPAESELLLRVRSAHEDEAMPPRDKKDPLPPEQIAKLERWIKEGAEYQGHWAFIAPERPALPKGAKGNPIDTLVALRRDAAGLQPSAEAPPEALIRRLSLDLVGLPPTPAEVEAFVTASRQNRDAAYRALVEKLLGSSRYGEKWARHWLDVARYADSDGYEKDLPRQQWAWRDWVIDALNRDKPYDQFIIEQIAGDLLVRPEHTAKQRQELVVATGFLRNSMISEEGAIIAEQYRKEGMFDRMDCVGKAVLGLTLQCAQCHTHKFDPITHKDYYSLFAAIDDTYESTARVYSSEKLARLDEVERGLREAEARAKQARPDWAAELEAWAGDLKARATAWQTLVPSEPVWAGGLSHPEALPDHSVLTLGFRATSGQLSFTTQPKLTRAHALRLEALTHGDLIFGGPGRSDDGLFAVTELVIETQATGAKDWKKHALVEATADFESPSRPLPKYLQKGDDDKRLIGPAAYLIDGKDETAWSPDRGPGRRNAPVSLVARFKEPLELTADAKLRVTLHYKHGGKDTHGRHTMLLGRYRVALTDATEISPPLRPDVAEAIARPAAERTAEQRDVLFTAWLAANPALAPLNAEIEALWQKYPTEDTTVLTLAQRRPEHMRTTAILDRGAWDQPRERVAFATPKFLPMAAAAGAEPARLTFARWLVDPRSPTTARVAVNRIWQALFGAGLVETSEDFGVRAAAPVLPEVLDWLAVEFMEGGWKQKELIRAIVLSSTYRQSSRATPELLERDPRNKLLARGPRFRVEAEVVRDIALTTSGLLHEKLGGPSFFAQVPESLFSESFIEVDFWKTAAAPERYRRSLYVFRRRSMPDPVLASFDAPNGDSACAARPRSNTPLAALASLNEPLFVDAARALALRILREGGKTDAERAAYGFRICTARAPQPAEIADLLELTRSTRARMSEGWIAARVLAFGDAEKLPDLPAGTTPNDAAAWTLAARVLLNLDETLSKN